MKTSDAMNIVYSLAFIKELTNDSIGQTLIIKLFEDYLRMLNILQNKSKNKKIIIKHVSNLLNNDAEFISRFFELQKAILELKKLDEIKK